MMKKILFVAISAIALMACGNGNDPDQPSGESKSKEQLALEYIGGKARTTLYSPTAPVLQKMKDLGFTQFSQNELSAPRKAPKGMPGDVYRFFMNAPEVENWRSVDGMTDEQQEAFNQVMADGKIYLEARLTSYGDVITYIELFFRAKSGQENAREVFSALFQAAWDDFQTGGGEQWISWKGEGYYSGDGRERRFDSCWNIKEFLKNFSPVYAACSAEWLYPEKPSPSLQGDQYEYFHKIVWDDKGEGNLIEGEFRASVYEYNPDEEEE